MNNNIYDCIIVGGGPAGLSAALFLARYRRRVLTFHNNRPRNSYSRGVHGFLGHHGIMPNALLARGRDEVIQHGGLIIEGCVTKAEKIGADHFRITAEGQSNHSFESRRVLLATGVRDVIPDYPGFREFYGVSIHHCPDCDGFEVSDKRVVVLGCGTEAVGFTLGLTTWTDNLTLIFDGNSKVITDNHRAKLNNLNIGIDYRRISGFEGNLESGLLERVRFTDGSALECDALFFNLGNSPASNLHTLLGCKLDEECGLVWVSDERQTSIPGVYAAGDLTPLSQLAVVAAAEGAMAAIHIHKSLIPDTHKL
jgi:thioredoxin reductase